MRKAIILLEAVAHKLKHEFGGEDAIEMSDDIETAISLLEEELEEREENA